jgi:hypothetical protein
MAFIVLLREPVSRTVSSYKFKVATKREHRPFVQAMREGMQQHAALIARIRSSYAPAPAGGAAAAAQGVGGEQLEAPIACVEDTDADKTEAYTRLYFTEPGPGRTMAPVLQHPTAHSTLDSPLCRCLLPCLQAATSFGVRECVEARKVWRW